MPTSPDKTSVTTTSDCGHGLTCSRHVPDVNDIQLDGTDPTGTVILDHQLLRGRFRAKVFAPTDPADRYHVVIATWLDGRYEGAVWLHSKVEHASSRFHEATGGRYFRATGAPLLAPLLIVRPLLTGEQIICPDDERSATAHRRIRVFGGSLDTSVFDVFVHDDGTEVIAIRDPATLELGEFIEFIEFDDEQYLRCPDGAEELLEALSRV